MGRKRKTPGAGKAAPEWVQYESPAVAELLEIQAEIKEMRGKPHTIADAAAISRRLSDVAGKVGQYYFSVPEGLMLAGQAYYNEHAAALKAALIEGGADAETVFITLRDYGAALLGLDLLAAPQQMKAALKACKPETAYNIDKYGLFFGLLYRYQRNLNALADYTLHVKRQPDASPRDAFFNAEIGVGEFSDVRAAALYWLQNIGYITADDFAGIDKDTISRFLTYVELYGQNGHFIQYVYIAQHALNATPEQLEQLPPPQRFLSYTATVPIRGALDYAGIIGEEINIFIERFGEQVEAAAVPKEQPTATTEQAPAPQGQGKPEQEQTARGIIQILREPQPGQIISISEHTAQMLSRPLYASTDGKQAREILPISAFIADYMGRNADSLPVTPELLEKAVEGVNLLQQLKRTQPANGIYTLETNLTEFSTLCGYDDANETEKQQLLTALRVLHNLYIVLWKPTGRVAVQLFGLQQYGLADGGRERKLVLNVFASGFRGRPQFWDAQKFALMRKKEKGATVRRFKYQITAIGHATDEYLLTWVFGYDKMRAEALKTEDAGQMRNVEEYIRKHKSRDKKRLAKMFEDFAADGILTYTVTKNKDAATVYKWKRLKPITPDDPEQEPNQEQEPEI